MRLQPRVAEAAAAVRAMIAGGTLEPGQEAPSAQALREATGICRTYCLRGLGLLEAEGLIVAARSPRGKVRVVAGPAGPSGGLGRTPGGKARLQCNCTPGLARSGTGEDAAVDSLPLTDAVAAARVRDALARQALGPAWAAGGHAREAELGVAARIACRYPGLGRMILAAYEWHRDRILAGVTGGSSRFPAPPAAGVVIAGAPLPVPGPQLHERAAAAAPRARFAYTAPHPDLADVLAGQVAGPSGGRVQVVMARAADPGAVMGAAPVTEMTALGPVAVHLVLVPARWHPALAPRVTARYAGLLPPGSTLSVSVITAKPGRLGEAMMDDASLAGGPGYSHSPADVEGWLTGAGLVLHPDGARPARAWRKDWAGRYPVAPLVPGRVTVAAGLKPGG